MALSKTWRDRHPEKTKEYIQRAQKKQGLRYKNDPKYHKEVNAKALERKRRELKQLEDQINNLIKEKGKCEKCGFSDLRALEIHHHFGDQNKHNPFKQYREIIEGKIPYSILCANCHTILHNPRKIA